MKRWFKDYKRVRVYLEPSPECPLLETCKKATGIDCKGRDFVRCDLLLNIMAENRHIMSERMKQLWGEHERILDRALKVAEDQGYWRRTDKRAIHAEIMLKGEWYRLKISNCYYDRPYRDVRGEI